MSRTHAFPVALGLSLLLAACGGGGGGSNNGGTPGGTTPPPTTTADPCGTALLADMPELASTASAQPGGTPVAGKKAIVDGGPRGRLQEALALHQWANERRHNAKIDGAFRSALGTRLTLQDDDAIQVNIPFSFPFYGAGRTVAFINSDGNITLEEEDKSSTERNLGRMVTGPPRIAPFFADLDPTTGSGRIFVNAAADQYTVTWCNVRGFDSTRAVTVQATLLPDGSVEMKFGDSTNVQESIVGISPGHTADIALVDLTSGSGSSAGAIAERFAQATSIDTFAVAKKFYATHPDNYDQILLWSDQPLIRDAFAYELNIANEVRGIGDTIYDTSRLAGSAGRLRSLVMMDWLGKYPEDPTAKFLGENNTLSVLGQEVGHRWLAYVDFRDRTGTRSQALLGRDDQHWSFFLDSDASVMEGNDIEDLGGGQFRTVDAVKRYSRLDQYIMGLIPPSSVGTFFYVESPNSPKVRGDAPQINVSFTGTRRDVLVDDIIAVNGQRIPSSADTSKTHRQAFIYIVSSGRTAEAAQLAKPDRIRTQWEAFFLQATDNRMTANTRLR